ncbi:uncharacterized protein [Rutidosis leptorrhynchoides]|uniref:uncharacterized protein n=1 Tax=Rutidosis leptorrhynchoides TaxID=125765 RepID=UPI003A9956E2
MESVSSVTLNAACTAVVTNQLPEKLEDPGCFTIPCLLGDLACMRALADLGASINLMPYSIYLKLAPGELRPTRMAIQLADHSIKYPRGIIENMLVKTGTLVFPADFVVLDMEVDERIPLILGRPFLNTARCLIDVYGQQLTLRIGDQKVSFAIDKALKYPGYLDDTCFFLQTVDTHVEFLQEFPELQGTGECEIASDEGDVLDEVDLMTTLMAEGYEPTEEEHEKLEKANAYRSKTSIEEAPELELKPLPDNLEYAFLGEESKLPVIIASGLSVSQKSKLVSMLKAHKPAIAWKIQDIKDISPSYCTHKILMEDNFKPCVQRQRPLNPHMQEVVKKEIVKLLDAGLIYPISDSP